MSKIYNCTGHTIQIPNMVSGQGCHLFDEKGKQFLDLESGVWCLALGHSHKRLNQVIKDQVDAIMHAGYCYSNAIVEAAAAALRALCVFHPKP